jgi:hypothetical protein
VSGSVNLSTARSAPAGRLWAAVFVALAALLMVLAAPQFVAALLKVPGDAANIELLHNGPLEIGNYDDIIASRQAAGRWVSSGRVDNSIGWAALQMVRELAKLQLRQPEEEARFLTLGIAALERGVAGQPLQPYAWYNLALGYGLRNAPGDAARVEQAWRMSVMTSPNENAMLIPRTAMGLSIWASSSPSTRALVAAEVARVALNQPLRTGRMARGMGNETFVKIMLAGQPDLFALFNEMSRLPEAGSPLFP